MYEFKNEHCEKVIVQLTIQLMILMMIVVVTVNTIPIWSEKRMNA
ncbi:Uncharacterised protein [Mycobacteroides abscessus subsp. abscessus]|nr:Uncharacterised protein [Mycobacteroides abscessus subsp. abscessus]